jgi:hypothetical protein
MRTVTRTRIPAGLLLLAAASVAQARPCADRGGNVPETYAMVKAGGYGLGSIQAGDDLDGGRFVGVESGVSPSRLVDVGLSLDWFHRERVNSDVVILDTSYDLPVEGYVDVDGSSTDLLPLGAVLRLRLPLGDGRFTPFVAGHLTYDILRLASHRVVHQGDTSVLVEQTDYFHGPGGTVSVGVDARFDPRLGLLMEAGAHGSEPSKDLVVDGTPVRGRVVTDGSFARIGVRLAF